MTVRLVVAGFVVVDCEVWFVGSLDRSGATNSAGSPDGGCIVSDGSDWQTPDASEDASRYFITLSTCCGLNLG